MSRSGFSIAEALGFFFKWLAIAAVFVLSLTLSLTFFMQIAPPDKPWFPLAGLSLTEGGLLCWLVVFMLNRHEIVPKTIALIMVIVSLMSTIACAGYEFYSLMASRFDLVKNTWIVQTVSLILLIVFLAHFLALIADLFAAYFSMPGHTFRGLQPRQESYAEDVRTSGVRQLPAPVVHQEDVRTSEPEESEPETQPIPVVRTTPKKRGRVMRYLTGERMDGEHGRDCACSGCRPDLHPVIARNQEGKQ